MRAAAATEERTRATWSAHRLHMCHARAKHDDDDDDDDAVVPGASSVGEEGDMGLQTLKDGTS